MRSKRCGPGGDRAAPRAAAACALFALAALVWQAAGAVASARAGTTQAQRREAGAGRLSALLGDDARTPPEVKVTGAETRDGVTVEDITFEGSGGAPVAAYLVRPSEGRGTFAGVLFVH